MHEMILERDDIWIPSAYIYREPAPAYQVGRFGVGMDAKSDEIPTTDGNVK